jgi:hypothetical protein
LYYYDNPLKFRKDSVEKKILPIMIMAFVCELFLFAADLGILPSPWVEHSAKSELSRIGKVSWKRQSVQKKARDSILWQSSESGEPLYSYDSVLTLKNSSAKLKLDSNIQIDLQKNTLVVLEPSLGEDNGRKFRIQFFKGDLRSKTGDSPLSMQSGSWTVEAKQNTDLALKTLQNGRLSVEVRTGSAKVQKSSGGKTTAVMSGTRLELSEQRVEQQQNLSDDLVWESESLFVNHFSFEFPVTFQLRRRGQGRTLVANNTRGDEISYPLDAEQRLKSLFLDPGTWNFRLENPDSTSKTLSVNLYPAKKTRHLYPLPRSRVDPQSQVDFSWAPNADADSYKLIITSASQKEPIVKLTQSPQGQHEFDLPADYKWKVIGLDESGFEISNHYEYPLYVIPDPLAPPKLIDPLEAPSIRQPAESGDRDGAGVEPADGEERRDENRDSVGSGNEHGASAEHRSEVGADKECKPEDGAISKVEDEDFERGTLHEFSAKATVYSLGRTLNVVRKATWSLVLPQAEAQAKQSSPSTSVAPPPQPQPQPQPPPPPPATRVRQSVIFSWFPVPGADHYTIEISLDTGFVKPIVIKKVRTTEFKWSGFPLQTVYYRVAAGQDNGRKGLFSEPLKVELGQLQNITKSKPLQPGIRVTVEELTPRLQKQLSPIQPEKIGGNSIDKTNNSSNENDKAKDSKSDRKNADSDPAKQVNAPDPLPNDITWRIAGFWSSGFSSNSQVNADSVAANQESFLLTRFGAELSFPLWGLGHLVFSGDSLEAPWKVEDSEDISLQPDLVQRDQTFAARFGATGRTSEYGVFYKTYGIAKRQADEKLQMTEIHPLGLAYFFAYDLFSSWDSKHMVGLGFGDDYYHFQSDNYIYTPLLLWDDNYANIGAEFNVRFGNGEADRSYLGSNFLFRLGLEF